MDVSMIVAPRSAARRPVRRATLPAVALVLAALFVVAGCADAGLGRHAAVVLAGEPVEVADDEGWVAVEAGEGIAPGARVRSGDEEAHLQVPGGAVRLGVNSVVRVHRRGLDLIRGSVLAETAEGYVVTWADTAIDGEGIHRLEGGVTPRVGVYEGVVEVHRFAERVEVPALRQVPLANQRLTGTVEPLAYRDDDPWDRRLLAAAISFDHEVERLARGIDREHGHDPRDAAFYETFVVVDEGTVPVLASISRVNDDDRFGPPAEALVTLFVATAVADAAEIDLERAVRDVTGLRAAGARWGLIALETGIDTRRLAQVVNLAQERRLVEAPGGEEPGGGAASDGGASGASGASGSGSSSSSPSDGDEGTETGGTGDPGDDGDPSDDPDDGSGGDDADDPLDDDSGVLNSLRDIVDDVAQETLGPLVGGDEDGGLLD